MLNQFDTLELGLDIEIHSDRRAVLVEDILGQYRNDMLPDIIKAFTFIRRGHVKVFGKFNMIVFNQAMEMVLEQKAIEREKKLKVASPDVDVVDTSSIFEENMAKIKEILGTSKKPQDWSKDGDYKRWKLERYRLQQTADRDDIRPEDQSAGTESDEIVEGGESQGSDQSELPINENDIRN